MQAERAGVSGAAMQEALDSLVLMLAPICPFITDELWQRFGHEGSVHFASFPTADESLLVEDYNQIVVQINGKVRSKISVLAGLDDDAVAAAAATEPAIADQLSGVEIRRTIVVPGRLVNFVVG